MSITPEGEEAQFVEEALAAVDAGSAGHWPTVAGYLADEVRRLREIVTPRPPERHECGCDGTPHWYPDGCPPQGLRHA
jgi:hypothetical protein